MKKIIRLTESDLTRIVRRVLSENNNGPLIDFKGLEKNEMGYFHDFGFVKYKENPKIELNFFNSGNEDLIIDCVRYGINANTGTFCPKPSWLDIDYPKEPTPPGGSGIIKITLITEKMMGQFNRRLTVESNAVNSKNMTMSLKGEALPPPIEESYRRRYKR